ncbi:MAG: hypothetical protein JSS34_06275 [Proteobacteria bacterium]|nr:hypothetical protein [Pseudomonadota bacterium]
MTFKTKITVFNFALFLGISIFHLSLNLALAAPETQTNQFVNKAPDSSDVSAHEGSLISVKSPENELSGEEKSLEPVDAIVKNKPEHEV